MQIWKGSFYERDPTFENNKQRTTLRQHSRDELRIWVNRKVWSKRPSSNFKIAVSEATDLINHVSPSLYSFKPLLAQIKATLNKILTSY